MSSTSQRFIILALGIALNIGVLGIKSEQANAQSYQYNFTTRYAQTTTDSNGFFSVDHGIESGHIWAINVAVQDTDGNWHTLQSSNTVANSFGWDNTSVRGLINSDFFYNRPVMILLFTY